jgi:ADP-heptose:LPS heptosyltransferase
MSVSPKKILIIHSGGIGDLLLALPAMRVFRRAFSEDILEIMGIPERLSLVAFDLRAQSIHSVDRSEMAYFFLEDGILPLGLVSFFASFEAILLFGGSGGTIFMKNLMRSGVQRVIFLPSFPADGQPMHVSQYLLDSLRSAGIEDEISLASLQIPESAVAFAETFWAGPGVNKGESVLAIHPGSGSPAKNWSPENFGRVADWAGSHAKVLLISGPAQNGREAIQTAMKNKEILTAENLLLIDLAAVLRSCKAYLGNDSGITHLAAWVGVPTVALFGPTDPHVWGPRGKNVRIITEWESCSPCGREKKDLCLRPCLANIVPERVKGILQEFF